MPSDCRGFPEYYSETLKLWETSFYEWKLDNIDNFEPGQICQAYISYENDKQYYLIQHYSDPFDEEQTLWKLEQAVTRQPIRQQRLQYFGLETNEFPVVKRSKLRFVVLLKTVGSNWKNPNSPDNPGDRWLVLPLFSYKPRHSDSFIHEDQQLLQADRFYFPASIEIGNRIQESAALFSYIQVIPQTAIFPVRSECQIAKMQKGFKISEFVLKLVVYHYFFNLGIINGIFQYENELKDDYQIFQLFIRDLFIANAFKQ